MFSDGGRWSCRKIKSFCNMKRGRVINKRYIESSPGPYPVYSPQLSENGKMGHISTYDFDGEYLVWATQNLNSGMVLYRNGKFSCTNLCGILSSIDKSVDMRYLAHNLNYVTKKYVNTIGNPKLTIEDMAEISVVIPDKIEVQQRIADLFDAINLLISQTESKISKLKNIRVGLMQNLLNGGQGQNSHHKESVFCSASTCQWNTFSAYDLFNIYIGGTPKKDIPEYWNGTIDWITLDDLNSDNRYVYESKNKISNLGLASCSAQILKRGMLILSARGTIGILSQLQKDMSFNQSCFGLDSKDYSKATNTFLYYVLSDALQKSYRYDRGNIFHTITRQTLQTMMISIPDSLCVQNEIIQIIDCHESKIEMEIKYLEKLHSITQGLLFDIFRGHHQTITQDHINISDI